MEWPAHQLLRQQCDPDVESCSMCSDEACSTSGDLRVTTTQLRKCYSDSSGYSLSSCSLKKLAAEDPPTAHKQQQPPSHNVHRSSHAQRAHSWKRRCMSYSRLDGWWVLCAEFLGTIILIALCVVAANQVSTVERQGESVGHAPCLKTRVLQPQKGCQEPEEAERVWMQPRSSCNSVPVGSCC